MNLQEWLERQHSLPDQLAVIDGLCSAINEDHQRGVLHRALEPANIEVLGDGRCNLQAAVRPEAATPGAAARYRAPEILEGAPYSPKADIYSVGVICYEMLSGRAPSGSAPPRPLSELRPELSPDLADGIMGCLERGPDWRPGDLSYLLQVVGQLRGAAARARPAKAAEPPPRTPPPAPRRAAARGASSKSALPLVAVTVLIAAAGGVGAWLWMRSQGDRASGPRAAVPPPTPVPTMVPPPAATPEPEATATPTPRALEKPLPTPEPAREAPPKPTPPTPVTTPPTPRPAPEAATRIAETLATPTPEPQAAPPAEPAVLTALSPLTLKRPTTAILDLRGIGLRPDHQARVLKVKNEPDGITIVRQKYTGPTLIQVVVKLDESVAPGVYNMGVADARGTWSNSLSFTVTR